MALIQVIEILVGIAAVYHLGNELYKLYVWLKEKPSPQLRRAPSGADYVYGLIYSLLCALLWSLAYVSLSYLSKKAALIDVNVILLGSAFVFLLIGSWITGLLKPHQRTQPPKGASWKDKTPWIIATTNVLSFVLFIYALYFISASQTIALNKINPIFVAMFTWIWLKRRPSGSAIVAVLLVVVGTVLIMANDQFRFESGEQLNGSVLAIMAGASFALFSVGLERVERGETMADRLFFLGIVFFLSYVGIATVAYVGGRKLTIDPESLVILILNGLRIAVVYALYHAAIRRIGALLVSVIVALEVPFTMIWDSRFLDRSPDRRLILGAAVILIGALSLGWDSWRGAAEQPQPGA